MGMLTFQFPDPHDDELRCGHLLTTTTDGVNIFPSLLWDPKRKRFIGPVSLRDDNRPLYEIDAKQSADFTEFSPRPAQMVVEGGECEGDYLQWCFFQWYSAVPVDHEALLKLSISQADGPPKIIEQKLSAGCQEIEIRLKPGIDGMMGSIEVAHNELGNREKIDFNVMDHLVDRDATHPPIMFTLNSGESALLINRSLKHLSNGITLDVKLIAK